MPGTAGIPRLGWLANPLDRRGRLFLLCRWSVFGQTDVMQSPHSNDQTHLGLGEICPHLSDSDLRQASENLDRFLAVVIQILTRVLTDPEASSRLRRLTTSNVNASMVNSQKDVRSKI